MSAHSFLLDNSNVSLFAWKQLQTSGPSLEAWKVHKRNQINKTVSGSVNPLISF